MTMMSDEHEVRVTSATGGEKGKKPQRLSTIDPLALLVLGEVSGFGADKYASFNYLKGYDWSLSIDAALRHLLKHQMGEDMDPESGLPHLGHAAWHCLAGVSFLLRGIGTDDRYKGSEQAVEASVMALYETLTAEMVAQDEPEAPVAVEYTLKDGGGDWWWYANDHWYCIGHRPSAVNLARIAGNPGDSAYPGFESWRAIASEYGIQN